MNIKSKSSHTERQISLINGVLASCILGLTLEEEPMPEIGAAWQDWVAENLRLGCASEQLVAVLQQHGFSLASSMAAVAAVAAARAKII